MTQRWIAAGIAVGLLIALLFAAALTPLPYAIYSPGPTFDVLAEDADDAELIQIDGSEVDIYPADGEIRFTTVRSTPRGERPTLLTLMGAWLAPDRAIIPYEVAHPSGQTIEEDEKQGQLLMESSQDAAKAVALTELGYDLETSVQVLDVTEDGAAHGVLLADDVFLRVDGEPVERAQDVVDAVTAHEPGEDIPFRVRRDGQRLDVEIAPEEVDGEPRIGVVVGEDFEFPFDIKIRVDDAIGGPSAGLMFALAIYDTLTPGSLTGGEVIAGTGTVNAAGEVGPIGGITQKIAGAEDSGAELFFVPPDNCDDVAEVDSDLRLVKAETMHDARVALENWVEDPNADLPTC